MSTLHVYRGVPASGKTTAAMAWVQRMPGRVRINRDDIRYTMFGKYWGVDENAVTLAQETLMNRFMRKGFEIVSDATNLKARDVKSQMEIARKWGYAVEFRDFPVTLETAIARDAAREKQVGAEVIRGFFDRFIRDGRLPDVPELPDAVEFPIYIPNESMPEAIVVDIDGTLAHMDNHRGPYEYEKAGEDRLDQIVLDIVERYNRAGYYVIVLSGRDEGKSRDITETWLDWYGVPRSDLFMRPAGDERKDAVVKNELFEKHIGPYYNVKFVLDDRDQVVEMWRARGIKCLQVEPGAF